MEYTILYNSSIAIGIMAIVMTTALLTFVLTYYIVKKVKEQDIIKALPENYAMVIKLKDDVIKDKNRIIRSIQSKHDAERTRNKAALTQSQMIIKILAADPGEFL
jgi:tRNA uridine 5-carbamoylmethylation protein Kti12